jgi:DNA-directed RNA polymerase subunit N (RpoN/RPB10)
MQIPIKCFTCGEVIANKWAFYKREVRRLKLQAGLQVDNVVYLTKENTDKTPEGITLDKLKLNKICCRRHLLTHVDIE